MGHTRTEKNNTILNPIVFEAPSLKSFLFESKQKLDSFIVSNHVEKA
ncbi:hypothetical protein [Leuconostoc mesenteroides]|nr:hypothetical protein [Leuconostoc mesenteroides]